MDTQYVLHEWITFDRDEFLSDWPLLLFQVLCCDF